MNRRNTAIYFILFFTIAQMQRCNNTKKQPDINAESLLRYYFGSGLFLNDSEAHGAFICAEEAINNACLSTPQPDWGTRIAGSLTPQDGVMIEYDLSIDVNGDWVSPSTLKIKFSDYWAEPGMYGNTDTEGVLLNGNCRLDFSGGNTSQSLQKRIRLQVYCYLYYYSIEDGSTRMKSTQVVSDYMITEILSPVYSECYEGTFAGRDVIPLVEPGGDGCLQ